MPLLVISGMDPAAAFVPSAMTKNGTQQLVGDFSQIIKWNADTAGYPGSTVVSNGLQALKAKAGATVIARLPFSGGGAGLDGGISQQARLVVNGTVVLGPEQGGTSGVLTVSGTFDLKEGDVVKVEARCTVGIGGTASTIASGAGTYVRIA
ncbi:hypothetical protein ACFWF7_16375 [Nocardia sp. NPDC060256]|uniref:hypothetical protein n=1 Tax=unclassified Nocardia TaxID=2637762 RepID=UPI00365D912C